jgi:hypothetical protein
VRSVSQVYPYATLDPASCSPLTLSSPSIQFIAPAKEEKMSTGPRVFYALSPTDPTLSLDHYFGVCLDLIRTQLTRSYPSCTSIAFSSEIGHLVPSYPSLMTEFIKNLWKENPTIKVYSCTGTIL